MAFPKKRCRSRSLVRARKRRRQDAAATQQQRSSTSGSRCEPSAVVALPISLRSKPRPISLFERFMKAQGLMDPSEISSFLGALRRPLPTNFRVRQQQQDLVEGEWQSLVRDFGLDSWPIQGITGAWQLQPHSWFRSRDGLPPANVRSFLARHTKNGNISRQELVSMLPVTLLQIKSHHAVLDLCASPGSKTVQAIDSLYTNFFGRGNARNDDTSFLPTGFVVANELDPRRAHILSHRARQTLGERHASLAIVCHNATKFPNVQAPLRRNGTPSPPSYDRIICDVPCSGDGTLRKDLKVWKTWHPGYGIALHQLQIRIAKRGIALLKMGGMMTYSTCSFHPVEDEAVVAALLQTKCVEAVPPDFLLPKSLRWRPGRSCWTVLDDECNEIDQEQAPKNWPASLWYHPEETSVNTQLKHCVRLFPQDNDTGAFFIALLRKIKEFDPPSTTKQKALPLLTPVPDHHCLHRVPSDVARTEESTTRKNLHYFRRSQYNTDCPVFALSPSLAEHVVKTPGCAKLNLVSAGYKLH